MARYVFEGGQMWEERDDGTRVLRQSEPYTAASNGYVVRSRGSYPGAHHYGSTYTYKPYKPWEGVDRNKWPRTWMMLVRFYHLKSYYSEVKYVSDEELKARTASKATETTQELPAQSELSDTMYAWECGYVE